jgi:hypothetical protein
MHISASLQTVNNEAATMVEEQLTFMINSFATFTANNSS